MKSPYLDSGDILEFRRTFKVVLPERGEGLGGHLSEGL